MVNENLLSQKSMLTPVAVTNNVRELRKAAGLTQEEAAEHFGFSLRVWQTKEVSGTHVGLLRQKEYEYLLLLADRHPYFKISPRK